MSDKEIKVTPDKEIKDITVLCADNKYTKDYIKQQGTSSILITKEMFNNYRAIHNAGCWNMMMDWEEAADDAELTPPAYWSIINNYGQLADHYGEFESDDYDEDLDDYYDR